MKWYQEESEPHESVVKELNALISNQQNVLARDERSYRMFTGKPIGQAMIVNGIDGEGDKVKMNVVQSAVNTMVSKISKNRVRATFLTDDGNWGMQEQAKKLDRYVFGQFYKMDIYQETRRALRDACIFGSGIVKDWHDDNGDIHCKRVFKPCVIVDSGEVLYSRDPLTIYEVRITDKSVLKAKYPQYSQQIDDAKISDVPYFVDNVEMEGNLVTVVEAYRVMIDGKKPIMGKHFIGISGATFLFEDYKRSKVPYRKIDFSPNVVGWWGRGIPEFLDWHQTEINRVLQTISDGMRLMSSPSILVEQLSEIIDTHFDNEVGNIIKYSGTPPMMNFPQGISPNVVEWMMIVYAKAFEEVGLSQLTATSKKPEGLDSGKALREYNDLETERFAEIALEWEKFHLMIADAIIENSKEIAEKGGKPVVLAPTKWGAEKIDFKSVTLKGTDYIMQTYPTSLLPKTPSGRLAYVQEMVGAQMLTPEEGLSLMEFPDVTEVAQTKTAFSDDIKFTAYLMIEKNVYTAPEAYQNLDFGIAYMNSTYMRMKMRGLPQERLNLLQQWINDALSLKIEMTQPEQVAVEEMTPEDELAMLEQGGGDELLNLAAEEGEIIQGV